MRVVWGQHSGELAHAEEDKDETMDTEDQLSQDCESEGTDAELVKKKPENKKRINPTTIEARYARRVKTQRKKKLRLFMREAKNSTQKSQPIWIDVDHPGLEASVK